MTLCAAAAPSPRGIPPLKKPPMKSLEGKGALAGAAVAMEGLGQESPSCCSVCKATCPHAACRLFSVLDYVIVK